MSRAYFKGLVILVDVDQVMADFMGAIVERINREIGSSFTKEQVIRWSISSSLMVPEQTIWNIANERGFCASLEVLPGTMEALKHLRRSNIVVAVTAPMRGPHWMFERSVWLQEHLGFDPRNIIHCSDKSLVEGDVLIDDKPSTVIDWAHCHPNSLALLFDAPHNRRTDLSVVNNAVRVKDWQEAVERIERFGIERFGQEGLAAILTREVELTEHEHQIFEESLRKTGTYDTNDTTRRGAMFSEYVIALAIEEECKALAIQQALPSDDHASAKEGGE